MNISFKCIWDYLDFGFYLNIVDQENIFSPDEIECAYIKYADLVKNLSPDCDDFRSYLIECVNAEKKLCG